LGYKRGRQHGDSHEKWIKETRMDIRPGSRAADNGPQKDPRWPNCQEVETDRRSDTSKSIQYRIVARLALTSRSLCIVFHGLLYQPFLIGNVVVWPKLDWQALSASTAGFVAPHTSVAGLEVTP